MGDIQVRGAHTRPKIKDWRRLQLDNYYLSVDKADTANRNKDLRQLYIPELSKAVEDELQYLVVFENFNKRINDTEQNITDLQAQVAALESRVWDLETIQQILVDGVYGFGYINANTLWSPGVNTPVDATRLPINNISIISNVTNPNLYSLAPQFSADYFVDIRIGFNLTAAQNNRIWNIAIFENGIQLGPGFDFNTRDYSDLFLTGHLGQHLDQGDLLDVRLWPDDSSSSLTIYDFTYSLTFAGLDDPGSE